MPAAAPGLSDALTAAFAAGLLTLPSYTKAGTIGGVPTWAITLDAGSGNTVNSARVTVCPPTDTIGAQRLLIPTGETFSLALDSARVIPVTLGSLACVVHAVGISSSTNYTGAAFVIGSAEASLANVIANDARFEWLIDPITSLEISLERGTTTRTALLTVVGKY